MGCQSREAVKGSVREQDGCMGAGLGDGKEEKRFGAMDPSRQAGLNVQGLRVNVTSALGDRGGDAHHRVQREPPLCLSPKPLLPFLPRSTQPERTQALPSTSPSVVGRQSWKKQTPEVPGLLGPRAGSGGDSLSGGR